MGVHVNLWVEHSRIDPEAWTAYFDEALVTTRAYPPGALSLGMLEVGGVEIPAYTNEVLQARGGVPCIRIAGDRASKRTAESFEIPQHLRPSRVPSGRAAPHAHVLCHFGDDDSWPATVFARKTQGHPFHVLMVALGLLAECRFPGVAAVGGDIDARDGEQARALLQQLLGQRFDRPLCTDEPRLRSTLQPSLSPVAIDRAVQHLVRPLDPAIIGDILGHLRAAPLGKVRHELETFVPSAPSFEVLCNETQEVFVTLAGSLSRAFDDPTSEELLAALDHARALQILARTTHRRRLTLTEDAWVSLRQAPTEVLRFCVRFAAFEWKGWELHQVVRGIFENEHVREAMFARWSEGPV
ncbi:MAG: hypothetical protein ACRBN8_38710 [Nannocystales bacterium]